MRPRRRRPSGTDGVTRRTRSCRTETEKAGEYIRGEYVWYNNIKYILYNNKEKLLQVLADNLDFNIEREVLAEMEASGIVASWQPAPGIEAFWHRGIWHHGISHRGIWHCVW